MKTSRAVAFLALSLVGCQTVLRTTPVPATTVQTLVEHTDTEGATKLELDGVSASTGDWGMPLTVQRVAEKCPKTRSVVTSFDPINARSCPLDDRSLTWKVGTEVRVPNGHTIVHAGVAAGLAAALIYGNYECFGPGCSTAGKVAVGASDGIIVLGLVGILVVAAVIAGMD